MSFVTPWVHLIRERLGRGPVLRVIVVLIAVALVLGVALDRLGRARWPSVRAHALAEVGHGAEAEQVAIAALEARPDDEELLFFLVENHRRPRAPLPPPDRENAPVPLPKPPTDFAAWIDDARLDRLLDDARIPRRTATLARFVLDGDADPALEALVRRLDAPVVVKETGAGLSAATARRLAEMGVAVLDVAGAGGAKIPCGAKPGDGCGK